MMTVNQMNLLYNHIYRSLGTNGSGETVQGTFPAAAFAEVSPRNRHPLPDPRPERHWKRHSNSRTETLLAVRKKEDLVRSLLPIYQGRTSLLRSGYLWHLEYLLRSQRDTLFNRQKLHSLLLLVHLSSCSSSYHLQPHLYRSCFCFCSFFSRFRRFFFVLIVTLPSPFSTTSAVLSPSPPTFCYAS